jgi:NAD(P)-dependent dehydrogenase (short-subunit alcohol dehydrogenase family)
MTRTVLVTGASTGIGEACARRLDAMGWRVFAGVRREADAEALRRGASPRLTPVRLDVTEEAQVRAAAEAVAAAAGGDAGLDGLVNNAGIVIAGPLECLPLSEVRAQLEVNVVGAVAVTQACLPLLRRARGRIVNIGSISGRSAAPFIGAYSASKFALEALTDSLRVELAPWGIEVAIVEPGAIATPIWVKSQALAERNLSTVDPGARALYEEAMAAMRRVVEEAARRAAPADRVADAVAHALTARRPRTRYLVGADARLQAALARLLPDRLRDRLTARFMGLPRAG